MKANEVRLMILRIVLTMLAACFAFFGWGFIGFICSFGSLRPGFMLILCLIFVLGLFLLLMRKIWGVRWFANELVKDKKVKLLKIDGVEPSVENIRSGRYPFVETAYAITVRKREGNVRRFIDFLVSPVGRSLVEQTGYVLP